MTSPPGGCTVPPMSAHDPTATTLATPEGSEERTAAPGGTVGVAAPVARGPGGRFAPGGKGKDKGKDRGKKAANDGKEKAINGELARSRAHPKRTEGLGDHATPPVALVAGEAPKGGGGGGKGGPVARGPGGKFAPGGKGKSSSRGSAKRRADRAKRRADSSPKNVADRQKGKFLAPPGQLREDGASDTELTPDPTTPMEAAPDLMRASEPTIPLAAAPVRFFAPPLPVFNPVPRPAGPVTAMVAPRVGVVTGR